MLTLYFLIGVFFSVSMLDCVETDAIKYRDTENPWMVSIAIVATFMLLWPLIVIAIIASAVRNK